jgi:hypothetical protein
MNPRPTQVSFRRLRRALAASFSLATGLRAQTPTPAPVVNGVAAPAAAVGGASTPGAQLNYEQLETLLGPIALYPDALIALILPAATAPSDVVLAARYLKAKGDPAQIDNQPWDESVRGLAHYPEVVDWMDENLSWTKQVGEAFLVQPADAMQAVQRLRTRARAAGTLVDTPQQRIVTEGDILLIEPTQPDVIYVPRYDPDVVYYARSPYWNQPYLSFGAGFAVGSWLAYDFDWPDRTIWVGDWRRRPRTVWVRPSFPNRPLRPGMPLPEARPWRPPEHRYLPPRGIGPRPPGMMFYPRPMPGTPPRPPGDNYPFRRYDQPSQPRIIRPATPGTPSGGFTPPPVLMPPPTNIGAPPASTDRRRDRADPTPDRPRPEYRRTPPTVGAPPVMGPPAPVNQPPANGGGPLMGSRPERPTRPDGSNENRREPRANTPAAPQPPPTAAPAKPAVEPNNGPNLR